jgi:hypothetical protein
MIRVEALTEDDYIQPGKDAIMGHIEDKTYFISGI